LRAPARGVREVPPPALLEEVVAPAALENRVAHERLDAELVARARAAHPRPEPDVLGGRLAGPRHEPDLEPPGALERRAVDEQVRALVEPVLAKHPDRVVERPTLDAANRLHAPLDELQIGRAHV